MLRSAGSVVGGVRSGGLASGIRVVVEIVWKVWTMVVFSSSLRVGLLGTLGAFGLCGASRRDISEVLVSETRAGAGGSQDGVRAKLLSGRVGSWNMGALNVFFAGDIQGDSSGAGEIARKMPSAGIKTVPGRPIWVFSIAPWDVVGLWDSASREALDTQQLKRHSASKNST